MNTSPAIETTSIHETRYRLRFVAADGTHSYSRLTWGDWMTAAKFGEVEVLANRAQGFHVLKTSAMRSDTRKETKDDLAY